MVVRRHTFLAPKKRRQTMRAAHDSVRTRQLLPVRARLLLCNSRTYQGDITFPDLRVHHRVLAPKRAPWLTVYV